MLVRRGEAGIVVEHICAVRPIYTLGDVLGPKTWLVNIAVAGDYVAQRIDSNYLVIELIADERISVCKSHSAGWKGHRVAAWADVGEEVPEVDSGFIGFDDAAVVGVGDERVAVGESACKGHAAERHAASLRVRVHNSAWSGVRDLKGLVGVLVGDQDVSIREQFGRVGIVKSVILPHDGLIGAAHLDDATVPLIGDQHMSVPMRLRQIGILHRNAELIEPRASDAERSILPDDVATGVYEHNAIVDATIRRRAQWLGAARSPGSRHQSKSAYSFGIVGTDN